MTPKGMQWLLPVQAINQTSKIHFFANGQQILAQSSRNCRFGQASMENSSLPCLLTNRCECCVKPKITVSFLANPAGSSSEIHLIFQYPQNSFPDLTELACEITYHFRLDATLVFPAQRSL
jgi:hypothetical protein